MNVSLQASVALPSKRFEKKNTMAVVEIVLFVALMAGCSTTLIVLFTHCKSTENKNLEIEEEKPETKDKEA